MEGARESQAELSRHWLHDWDILSSIMLRPVFVSFLLVLLYSRRCVHVALACYFSKYKYALVYPGKSPPEQGRFLVFIVCSFSRYEWPKNTAWSSQQNLREAWLQKNFVCIVVFSLAASICSESRHKLFSKNREQNIKQKKK
jgi:hypothetical protein